MTYPGQAWPGGPHQAQIALWQARAAAQAAVAQAQIAAQGQVTARHLLLLRR